MLVFILCLQLTCSQRLTIIRKITVCQLKNFVKITCENLTGEIFHIQYVSNQWFLYMK